MENPAPFPVPAMVLASGPPPGNAGGGNAEEKPAFARALQLFLFEPPKPLLEKFGRDFFRELPERPGVYLMCGSRDGLLYVGKARNLRQRLGQYRSANPDRLTRKMRRLLAAVERIYWDECADEAAALDRERRLLLALRPRFNTVGKFPAPALRLGWQGTGEGLAIGLGPVTNGWERQSGDFTRLKPAYAALLRLVWRGLHPGRTCHSMPALLAIGRTPASWMFGRAGDMVSPLDRRLADFFQGTESAEGALPDWLAGLAAPGTAFDRQWCEQDADCLREFYRHHHGAAAPKEGPVS